MNSPSSNLNNNDEVIAVLVASNNEIREGMRDARVDAKEQRRETKDLIASVNKLANIQIESTTEHRHSRKEITEIKTSFEKFKEDVSKRIRVLEIARSNSLLKWAFLISTATVIIGLSTWAYTTFSKPQADVKTAISELIEINKTTAENISSITATMDENYNAVKAKAIAEKNHGAGE